MKRFSFVFVFLAGILWGTMGVFVRRYNSLGLDSLDIVAVRAVSTTFCMLAFLLVYDKKLFRIRLRDLWCFLGTGLCSIVFFNFCYFKAITLTSLSVAAVLLYTAPAIVMLLSGILFRERLTMRKLIALAATFAGCVLVTGLLGDAQRLNLPGILVGLGAGLGYALYSVFSRFALERGYHSFTISFYTFLIASAGTLPMISIPKVAAGAAGSRPMAGFTLLFGIVSTVLPYVFYTIGLQYMENGRASIIASVEPVMATLLGVFLYHEKMSVSGTLGMLLILGGIVVCNIQKPEKNG